MVVPPRGGVTLSSTCDEPEERASGNRPTSSTVAQAGDNGVAPAASDWTTPLAPDGGHPPQGGSTPR